jgi:hypothetical protein
VTRNGSFDIDDCGRAGVFPLRTSSNPKCSTAVEWIVYDQRSASSAKSGTMVGSGDDLEIGRGRLK